MTLQEQSVYEFGPYRIDGPKRLLLRDGEVVPLTPKCFEILLVLAENSGEVINKEDLMKRVWPDSFVEEGNVTYNISVLRKALGERTDEHMYIVTVPGRGYRFVARVSELPVEAITETADHAPEVALTPVAQSAEETRTASPRVYSVTQRAALVLILITVAGAGIYVLLARGRAIESIAVLPFTNVGADPKSEYLSDGITESLIHSLSQLPNLTVKSFNSVFRYKGQEVDAQVVGRDLKVQAVLTARMVQRGDSLSISAELVNVRDNSHLWGAQYDRKLADIQAVRTEILREISEKLRLHLSGAQQKQLTRNYTEDTEAYQLFLLGRYFWNKRTPEAIEKAGEYFQQAVDKDPSFALAYVGLADSYHVPANPLPPNERMPKAKAAAIRALQLDDMLAEAHASMGRIMAVYEWDWAGAEAEFKRAIELNPRYATAHQWYGGCFDATGRHDEAIAERKRALELDTVSLIFNFELGVAFYYARRYDQAIEQYQKTLELDARFPPVHAILPAAYAQSGMYDQAIDGFQKAIPVKQGTEWFNTLSGLGHAYAVSGNTVAARAVLDKLLQLSRKEYVPADAIALVYAGLGEKDPAFAWLEKAYEQRQFRMSWLKVEPRWDTLRSDPRFASLLRRVGLTP